MLSRFEGNRNSELHVQSLAFLLRSGCFPVLKGIETLSTKMHEINMQGKVNGILNLCSHHSSYHLHCQPNLSSGCFPVLKGIETFIIFPSAASSVACSGCFPVLKGIETDWMEGWKKGRLGRRFTYEGNSDTNIRYDGWKKGRILSYPFDTHHKPIILKIL